MDKADQQVPWIAFFVYFFMVTEISQGLEP
jgi:hypothetical protein